MEIPVISTCQKISGPPSTELFPKSSDFGKCFYCQVKENEVISAWKRPWQHDNSATEQREREQGGICLSCCLYPAGAAMVSNDSTLVSIHLLLFQWVMTSSSGEESEKGAVWAGNEGGGFGERENANVQLERDVVIIKQWQKEKKKSKTPMLSLFNQRILRTLKAISLSGQGPVGPL